MKTNQALFAIAAVAVSAFAGVSSCSSESIGDEPMGNQREAILYGSEDTTHRAVMALKNRDGGRPMSCTATLIAKKGDRGFVLTAAHCVVNRYHDVSDKQYLWLGIDNMYNPTATYKVERVEVHPLYEMANKNAHENDLASANDFAMLEISGVDSWLTPIPPMTPSEDNLAVGDELDIIGFGLTQIGVTNMRLHVVKPIAAIYSPWLYFDQSGETGGMNEGDSGGPAITTTGTPLVAGVSSFALDKEASLDQGYSGRVSLVYDSFIQPFIEGVPGKMSCQECRNSADYSDGACVSEFSTYASSFESELLAKCITGCKTASCILDCKNKYPEELKLYQAVIDCECAACNTSCGPTPLCSPDLGDGSGPGGKADDMGAGKTDDGQSNASGDENTSSGCSVSTAESGSSKSFGWVIVAGLAGAVVGSSRRRASGKRV